MIKTIYIIISLYFLLGACAFFLINRHKPKEIARNSWLKYGTYYLIINLFFFSIVSGGILFTFLCSLVYLLGFYELFRVGLHSSYTDKSFFKWSLALYLGFALPLFCFSIQEKGYVLFVFILLSIFDSFSQICGQIFGKTKLLPTISPNKTLEGMLGGAIITLLSSLVLRTLYDGEWWMALLTALLICVASFVGDALASFYKRFYGVKDFSRLIPGHGGILDRFDSLIVVGGTLGCFFMFN